MQPQRAIIEKPGEMASPMVTVDAKPNSNGSKCGTALVTPETWKSTSEVALLYLALSPALREQE